MLCYCQETNNAQSAPQHEGVHSRAACTNVQSPLCRSTRGEIVMEKEIFYTEVRSTLVATHETKSYCADHIYSHIRRDIYRIKRTLRLQCSIQQRTARTKGTTVVQVHVSVLQQEECVCTRRARQAKIYIELCLLQPHTAHALLIHNIEFSATTDHHVAHGQNQQHAETHVGSIRCQSQWVEQEK